MLDIKQLEAIISQQKTSEINLKGYRDGPSALKDIGKGVTPFQDLLKQEKTKLLTDELKFSGHAITRLHSRNIQLTGRERQQIVEGIDKLASKGAKDALMVMKDLAMIVSVDNKTVVTVMDKNQSDGVFTNIDSAVIL